MFDPVLDVVEVAVPIVPYDRQDPRKSAPVQFIAEIVDRVAEGAIDHLVIQNPNHASPMVGAAGEP